MSDRVLVTLLRYGFYNLLQFKTSGTYLLSKDRCFEFGLLVPQSFTHPAIIVHELEPKKNGYFAPAGGKNNTEFVFKNSMRKKASGTSK